MSPQEKQGIFVSDFDIPFVSLIGFMMKLYLASLIAGAMLAILIGSATFLIFIILGVLGAIFGG